MAEQTERRRRIGDWLKQNAPDILTITGEVLPFGDGLQAIGNLIKGREDVPAEDKLEFMQMLRDEEINAQQQVSDRWKADMQSDVKLAKLIRPLSLVFCLALYTLIMVWDSADESFEVRDTYLSILELLLMTIFGAYFAGRTIEKGVKNWRR